MSIFTNPAGRSSDQAHAYRTAVLALLGTQDPGQVLQGTPAAVKRTVARLTERDRSRPEASGKWSIRQLVRHLADAELVSGYRLRTVLAEARPTLTGYDQDRWAERLCYENASVDMAVEEFEVLRRSNLLLIAAVTPDDLRRVGVHAERGEESVADMIRLHAGHDLLHLAQLARIRRAIATCL